MKKICIIVMIALTLGVTGCGNKNNEDSKNVKNKNTTNVTEKGNSKDKEKTEENKEENKEEKNDETSENNEEVVNVLKEAVDKKEKEGFFQYNLSLSYTDGGKYKYSELKDSIQVTDEDGYKFEGDFYSNKYGAIETVLTFNKQWLEYVNNGSTDVYDSVLKNSEAYNDIKNFNKNNLTEKFNSLQIGEVRSFNDYYYVWTHEVIEEVRNGKTTLREYNWIYKLKKTEMDFYLVDFTRDNN